MIITFTVPGPPQGKARPRVVRTATGKSRSYTPDKTVAYEELVRQRYLAVANGIGFGGKDALMVTIVAYYPIPASVSKRRRADMLAGNERPTKKPDYDNIGKIVCDALNGIAYQDDAQITDGRVVKRYTDGPGEVWVRIWSHEVTK